MLARTLVLAASMVLAPGTAWAETYDLAQDLKAREALAHEELGPHTRTTLVANVFLFVGDPSGQALLERALSAFYSGRFVTPVERAVSVYAFPAADAYSRYCKRRFGKPCASEFGFYRPDLRRIVMNMGPGPGTLTHEIVHAIFDTDFPAAPLWLEEGMASLFEAPAFPRPNEIHGAKNWRLPKLIQALSSSDPDARLERLVELSDAAFRLGDERLHYAVARYFCQWLDSRGLLWPFYRAFRERASEDPTGLRTLAEITGQSAGGAQEAWAKWVRRL